MSEKPDWAARIERERRSRGWTQAATVRELRKFARSELPGEESMLRSWKGWESGRHRPSEEYQRLIASAFGTVTLAIFGGPVPLAPSLGPEQTLEVIERVRRSDLNEETIHGLEVTVEDLCTRYSYADTDLLLAEATQWMSYLNGLLGSKLTFGQHGKTLELFGWVTLLVGCLSWDNRDLRSAESARRTGLEVGKEVGNVRIQSWSHEMTGWFASTQGDWQRVLASATVGQEIAGKNDIAAQIASQEAEAWARLDEPGKAQAALGRAQMILEMLPPSSNPNNHFVVDHDKFDKVAMRLAALTGSEAQALALADELVHKFIDADGTLTKPMRIAEAYTARGIVAARNGDITRALEMGHAALDIERQSIPSLAQDAADLVEALASHSSNSDQIGEYEERVRKLRS